MQPRVVLTFPSSFVTVLRKQSRLILCHVPVYPFWNQQRTFIFLQDTTKCILSTRIIIMVVTPVTRDTLKQLKCQMEIFGKVHDQRIDQNYGV